MLLTSVSVRCQLSRASTLSSRPITGSRRLEAVGVWRIGTTTAVRLNSMRCWSLPAAPGAACTLPHVYDAHKILSGSSDVPRASTTSRRNCRWQTRRTDDDALCSAKSPVTGRAGSSCSSRVTATLRSDFDHAIIALVQPVVAPLLRRLHWLPVPERVQFKLCDIAVSTVLVLSSEETSRAYPTSVQYKDYAQRLLQLWLFLLHDTPHLATDRAFPVIGARLWNSLPDDITTATSL